MRRERRLQHQQEQARPRCASEMAEHREERLRNWIGLGMLLDQTAAETAEKIAARLQASRRASETAKLREERLRNRE